MRGQQAAVKAAAEAEAEATASMAREASNLGASSKHSRSMEVDDSCTPPPATGHKLRSAGKPQPDNQDSTACRNFLRLCIVQLLRRLE